MSPLIALAFIPQSIAVGLDPGLQSAGDLSSYYDARHEVTFSGSVTGKTKGSAPGYTEGMSILVRSGKTVRQVELGPSWFVGRQEARIDLGDKVTVTGTPLKVGKREQVILARQIRRGKKILALRDRQGYPYWSAIRRQIVAAREAGANGAAQDFGTRYNGTISGINTVDVDGTQYAGYVVTTPTGPQTFAVAPTWYWNQQPTNFRVGDTVTLFGQGGATRVGGPNGVILVNSFYTPNYGTIILRPGGVPVWNGFRGF